MHRCLLFYLLFFGLTEILFSQGLVEHSSYQLNETIGINYGYVLPSKGHINALIIFAQFKDDNYLPDSEIWQKQKEPDVFNKWLDEKWSENPTVGSLTHYFSDMSLGELKFTGKTISTITNHNRQYYIDSCFNRYDIQKEIIQGIDDSLDFAGFDNWDFVDYNQHLNQPDGIVDLILIIWRNIEKDYPDSLWSGINNKLNFLYSQADLGFDAEYYVDEGKRRIKSGFFPLTRNDEREPGGSGLTIINYLHYGSKRIFQVMIHEISHFFLGTNPEHTGLGFWGLMSHWGMKSFVVNSFEREKLGWGEAYIINNFSDRTVSDIKLRDNVSTGEYIKLIINDARNEYFFLENHQGTSFWETNFENSIIEPGIYVIRSDGRLGSDVHLIPADGRHSWRVNQMIANPWGEGELPVFFDSGPDRINGTHDCELQTVTWSDKNLKPQAIHFTEDIFTGKPVKDVRHNGDGRDAFRLGYNEIFSPYSNPNSQDVHKKMTPFGFLLKEKIDDDFILDIFVNTALDAPPSKPQGLDNYINDQNEFVLTWLPNIEPDVTAGGYYKIFFFGLLSENIPTLAATIPSLLNGKHNTSWDFNDSVFEQNTDSIDIKITAVDNSGLESVYSDSVKIKFKKN